MDYASDALSSTPVSHTQQTHNPSGSLADAEQYALKRTYLNLLSTTQLVELCLAFEPYAPLHIKGALWPGDLRLAIASLGHTSSGSTVAQPTAPPTSNNDAASLLSTEHATATEKSAELSVPQVPKEPPLMDSLREPTPPTADPSSSSTSSDQKENTTSTSTGQGQPVTSSSATPQPSVNGTATTQPSSAPTGTTPASSSSSPPPPAPTTTSQPTQPPHLHPGIPAQFPHAPYGFPHGHLAYPHHNPYYPPPGFASQFPYPYPPGAFPPHPHAFGTPPHPGAQTAASNAASPNAAGRGSPFTTTPLHRPPPPPSGPTTASLPGQQPPPPLPHPQYPHGLPLPPPDPNMLQADDIPSYEDMIVEALSELEAEDPEGSPPKTVFSWMASHYPLHTNFRPSASQALQKAFKRGRLEKSDGGKYRLKAGWDGAVPRRHTRRPMSNGFLMQPSPNNSSPFTRAPLVHPQTPGPHVPGAVPYPGFSAFPPFASTSASTAGKTTIPTSTHPTNGTTTDGLISMDGHKEGGVGDVNVNRHADVGEGSDAWEAAQNILRAINFGSLFQIQLAPATPDNADASASGKNGQDEAVASGFGSNADVASGSGVSAAPSVVPPPVFASDFNFGTLFPSLSSASMFTPAPASTTDASTTTAPVHTTDPSVPSTSTAPTTLSNEDRAALQAQLALLAAQLKEIAEDEDWEDDEDEGEDAAMNDAEGEGGAEIDDGGGEGMDVDGDDSDDDDDMEMVPVPIQTPHEQGLRT